VELTRYEVALAEVYSGRLSVAAETCRQGLLSASPEEGKYHALLASIFIEQGETALAGEEIRSGLSGAHGDALPQLSGALARLWRIAEDWDEALAAAEVVSEQDPMLGQAIRAYILSARGDPAWLEEESVRSLGAIPLVETERTDQNPWAAAWHLWGGVWVRVAAARARRLRISKEPKAAAMVIQPVLVYLIRRIGFAERDRLTHRLIELSIFQSLAMDALGDRLRALVAVERAVRMALPGRYQSVFREEGEGMRFLLEAFRAEAAPKIGSSRRYRVMADGELDKDSMVLNYVDFLLDSFADHGQTYSLPASLPEMQAHLTPREMEILTLLAGGKSYQDIADRLFLSLPTVRWHIHSLYIKLGVSTRVRAIARAREMNLL